MPSRDQIDELMLRWEAARQQGQPLTAEQLCAACPSCLDELRGELRAVEEMEKVLGVGQARATLHSGQTTTRSGGDVLPDIPGYDVLSVLDEGGMGIVYEARQNGLGRRVAIKMIARARLAPAVRARFRAEAEAAARLHHPNFVQVFEVGQVNDRPFFSMEYVDGGSLAQHLAGKPLPPRRAAELAETLAHAIHAAHDCGIVHRDLKPANILLSADGVPKIGDFGLAKRLDAETGHTQTGEILGTPSYMAPEQAEGRKNEIGPATDVYALGTVLYEMLTARPPFKGATALESLRQVMHVEPTPPSKLTAGVPRDLEAICLKCLEKAPRQRYATARALAEDLGRFLEGRPVSARSSGPLRRAWKWARRHPRGVAAVAGLCVLTLLTAWMLLTPYWEHKELRERAELQAPLAREILQRNCHQCHGGKALEKNLNILDHALLLDSKRRIVVPGDPDGSRLIRRIEDGSMPPEEEETHLPRLSQQEIKILKEWVLGGAPPFPPVDPERPVGPVVPYSELAAQAKQVFQENCYECHKYDVAKNGIKILHHRLLVSVREVVIPGRPEDSELFQLLNAPDAKRMPPADYAPRLAPAEIHIIRRWIEEGAAPFP
jgi:mono/diheme cytochrome c family protein/predicted Ser/Thr protein kinase